MLFSLATIALVASLPALGAPVEKRINGAVIRSGRTNTCLTLTGAPSDGALLTVGDCQTATKFDINRGSGSVLVSGTNFALDAGVPQGNNAVAKVWTSYPGSTQQTWYYTDDNRIAVTGGNQCLDQGDNGPQTYQCTPGNTNQVWFAESSGLPPTSSSAAPSASSSSSAPTSTPSSTSATVFGWTAQPGRCLTSTGAAADGTPVELQNCVNGAGSQRFSFLGNGQIQYAGTNFCLDAGSNPSNGTPLKMWTCYGGLAQQTWVNENGRYRTANNQCLDVASEGNSDVRGGTFTKMQTWECSPPDVYQSFFIAQQR